MPSPSVLRYSRRHLRRGQRPQRTMRGGAQSTGPLSMDMIGELLAGRLRDPQNGEALKVPVKRVVVEKTLAGERSRADRRSRSAAALCGYDRLTIRTRYLAGASKTHWRGAAGHFHSPCRAPASGRKDGCTGDDGRCQGRKLYCRRFGHDQRSGEILRRPAGQTLCRLCDGAVDERLYVGQCCDHHGRP